MAEDRPFRLRVLDALTERLRSVTPAAGYRHDLSNSVYRGRSVYGPDDLVDGFLVSILEAPLPDTPMPAPNGSGEWVGPWELFIQGFIDDDHDHPTDPAHFLMADVKKALAVERKRMREKAPGSSAPKNNLLGMNGRVTELSIGACVVRPAEEHVSELANFLLSISLTIAENMDDPYA